MGEGGNGDDVRREGGREGGGWWGRVEYVERDGRHRGSKRKRENSRMCVETQGGQEEREE